MWFDIFHFPAFKLLKKKEKIKKSIMIVIIESN